MTTPLRTRFRAFLTALRWLALGRPQTGAALRGLLEDDRVRAAIDVRARDPSDPTPWEVWRPPTEDSDGRFWLLTQSAPHAAWGHGREAERAALWMAWCDRLPAGARRAAHAIARNAFPWPVQTRFQAVLTAAMDLERVPVAPPDPSAATLAAFPMPIQIGLLQLSVAVGHNAWTQRLQEMMGSAFPNPPEPGMPWAGWLTLFHRGELLESVVAQGHPLYAGVDMEDALLNAIDERLYQWPKQLHALAMGTTVKVVQQIKLSVGARLASEERRTLIEQMRIRMGSAPPLAVVRRSSHTPVWWAVEFGNAPALAFLLKQGANVNEMSSDGECVLSLALAQQRWDMTVQLVEAGADPLIKFRPQKKPTNTHHILSSPLRRLIEAAGHERPPEHKAAFQRVVESVVGAARLSPDFVPQFQSTDNHWVTFVSMAMTVEQGDLLLEAALKGVAHPVVTTFHTVNPTPLPHQVKTSTLLREAFEPNRVGHLVALAGHGVGLDFDDEFSVPLGIAMAARVPEALSAWIKAASPAELTILAQHTARKPSREDVKGACRPGDPTHTWQKGDNVWFAALRSHAPDIAVAALAQAPALLARAGDAHPETGRTVWQETLGWVPSRCGAIESLLAHVGPFSWTPGTPLPELATFFTAPRHEAVAERLLAAKALPLNAPLNDEGHTLLHMALAQQDMALFQLLLAAGADPTVPNAAGITAQAQAAKFPDAAPLLAAWAAQRLNLVMAPEQPVTVRARVRL